MVGSRLEIIQFPKPILSSSSSSNSISRHAFVTISGFKLKSKTRISNSNQLKIEASNSVALPQQQYSDSDQFFEKLRDSELEQISRSEEAERQAKLQLERQVVMASDWSRALLTMRGKLKGTQWDPETSHKINYFEFQKLLNTNSVKYMEYSNYGQTLSVILPYYKNGILKGSKRDLKKEIVFKRHEVDRMPVDCWNDVWQKLHQQLVNVDVHNANAVSAEVYSTVAIAVVWSMRVALAIAIFFGIDSMMRLIYARVIPFRRLGSPPKKIIPPLEINNALGSLGKSR